MIDLALIGGGLANALVAWRLHMTHPGISLVLLEAGTTLGAHRAWSFLGTDVTKAQLEWLWVLLTKSWPSHDVAFTGAPKRLGGGFHSLTGEDLHWKLVERLGERVRFRATAVEVGPTHVLLDSGERLEARAVIDGREPSPAAASAPGGFRHTVALELELERPHALEVPLVDARFPESEAFRFATLLPWDERRLRVTETAYSTDASTPDARASRARLLPWLATQGLVVKTVLADEVRTRALPSSGEAPALTRPLVGPAAGLFHATTGESLPMAVDVADELAKLPDLAAPALTAWLAAHARRHWAQQAFYRRLTRMLLNAGDAGAQRRLFASLSAHGEDTVARFHAGTLSLLGEQAVFARAALAARSLSGLRAGLAG